MHVCIRMKPTTLKDVARRAGVAHSTVSRVLTGKNLISEATRQRVLSAVQELKYQPNHAARELVSRREGRFPICVEAVFCHLKPVDERPAGSFQMQVLRGLHEVVREDGQVDLRLSYWQSDADMEPQLMRLQRANGIVALGNSDYQVAKAMRDREMKIVLADHDHDGLPLDSVTSDNMAGGKLAARYLLDRGHKRIGWIGGPLLYTAYQQRLDGLRLQLQLAGLTQTPHDCRIAEANENEAFERLMEAWIREGDLPSAVVVSASFQVSIVLHVLREHNIRCPQDISLICCDHDAFTSSCRPTLTTLTTYPKEIGRRAMERLIQIVRAPRPETPMKIVMPMTLIEGKSVRTISAK